MPSGGTVVIRTANAGPPDSTAAERPRDRPGGHAMIEIADTGTGMDAATSARIFEPFFTTKAIGKGTGLGLSTVQGIVLQSGGRVEVESEPGNGTTFRVFLPATTDEAAGGPLPVPAIAVGGNETVLVVEDQAEVRQYVAALLKAYGYIVVQAGSVVEGLEACERGAIDLLVTDVVMPQASGRDLARQMAERHPGIKVLFMSGYAPGADQPEDLFDDGRDFIQKPFGPEALAGKVRSLLGPQRQ